MTEIANKNHDDIADYYITQGIIQATKAKPQIKQPVITPTAKPTSNNPLTKDNPARTKRDLTITNLRANGDTYSQIATKTGLTKGRISQILSDDDCKAILDKTIRKYISHADTIGDKFLTHCASDESKISLDAIKHYHQITGIAPSHSGNLFFQAIYNTTANLITQDVESLLGMLSGKAAIEESDIIDAELLPDPQT